MASSSAWRSRLAARARLLYRPIARAHFALRGKSLSMRESAAPYLDRWSGPAQLLRAEIKEHAREEVFFGKAPAAQERLHHLESHMAVLNRNLGRPRPGHRAHIYSRKEKVGREESELRSELHARLHLDIASNIKNNARDLALMLALEYVGHSPPGKKPSKVWSRMQALRETLPFLEEKDDTAHTTVVRLVSPILGRWDARQFAKAYARIYRNLSR